MTKAKPNVSVLLSTYNGHQYIRQLVDSVLAQEDVNVKLQVRDDGSSDDTVEILKSYHDPRISIRQGKNLKPARSFLKLLKECDDSEYYAYCDQDDEWYPRKLITAVGKLEGYSENATPALYISTYDVCDKDMNLMFKRDMKFNNPLTMTETLIYRAPSACCMVFDHALRQVIAKGNPTYFRMHDFWTLLVAESHGYPIITEDVSSIRYRQHEGESVGITPTAMTRLKRLIKSFSSGHNERWRQAKSLYDNYKEEITQENLEMLEEMINYRNSFRYRVALANDNRFVTSSRYINMLFKASVLAGKF